MSTIPEEVIKATYEEAIQQRCISYDFATKRYLAGEPNVFFFWKILIRNMEKLLLKEKIFGKKFYKKTTILNSTEYGQNPNNKK